MPPNTERNGSELSEREELHAQCQAVLEEVSNANSTDIQTAEILQISKQLTLGPHNTNSKFQPLMSTSKRYLRLLKFTRYGCPNSERPVGAIFYLMKIMYVYGVGYILNCAIHILH